MVHLGVRGTPYKVGWGLIGPKVQRMHTLTIDELPTDVQTLARDYFDLMHHQDMDVFDRVFHPSSVLFGVGRR